MFIFEVLLPVFTVGIICLLSYIAMNHGVTTPHYGLHRPVFRLPNALGGNIDDPRVSVLSMTAYFIFVGPVLAVRRAFFPKKKFFPARLPQLVKF